MNIRTFDLNLLRAFDALLDEPQVSLAARRLNLSQPATSAALMRLRAALGDPLLVRTRNRMIPTPFAERLRPKVRSILAEIEESLRSTGEFRPAETSRSFRIAANDYAVVAVLTPVLRELQKVAPRMRLEVLPLEDDFDRRLSDGDYDLAIRDRWSMGGWRQVERLFREEYVSIARQHHPRLSRQPTLDDFLAEGHVLIAPRGRTPGVVDEALRRIKRRRNVVVTIPHFLPGPAIVAQTDYVMTIASRVALQLAETYGLRMFPPPIPIPSFEVALAWHPRGQPDSGINWLRERIRNCVGDGARRKINAV